jgi:hypothetical protein
METVRCGNGKKRQEFDRIYCFLLIYIILQRKSVKSKKILKEKGRIKVRMKETNIGRNKIKSRIKDDSYRPLYQLDVLVLLLLSYFILNLVAYYHSITVRRMLYV